MCIYPYMEEEPLMRWNGSRSCIIVAKGASYSELKPQVNIQLCFYNMISEALPNQFMSFKILLNQTLRVTRSIDKAIARPGQGSKTISMCSVDKRTLVSQGTIRYDDNLVRPRCSDGRSTLWAVGKQINQLLSLLHPCIRSDIFE